MTRLCRPPRLPRLLVSWLLGGEMREIVLGDLDEEFARHVATGATVAAARRRYWRQAVASLGVRQSAEVVSDRPHPGAHMSRMRAQASGLLLDLRHAVRVLGRTPGFTSVAVLSLAIGIGANTAVYSVMRTLLFDPLPVDAPEELTLVYWSPPPKTAVRMNQVNSSSYRDPATNQNYASNYTYAMFRAVEQAVGADAQLFAFNFLRQLNVSVEGQPALVGAGLLASGTYFSTLRLQMAAGRPFGPADDQPGAPSVAVLSHAFWVRAFGGDPGAIGRTIRINGLAFEIVGVTAKGYRGLSQGGFFPTPDVTLPLVAQALVVPRWTEMSGGGPLTNSNLFWIRILGRVRDRSERLQHAAADALRQSFLTLPGADPATIDALQLRLLPGERGLDSLRGDTERPLFLLTGVVVVVLLMASMNLSGLMLARGVSRARELAVRRALGANRWRVMRVLLCESVVLATAGGVLGLALAIWTGPLVAAMLTTGLNASSIELGVDWPLIGLAILVTGAAAVLSGVIPAVRLSRTFARNLTARGAGRLATGRTLIAVQIAVSVPLLIGALLFLRTVHNLGSVDLGFKADGLVIFRVDSNLRAGGDRRDPAALYDRVLERVSAVPGVASATLVENVLISGWSSSTGVEIDGQKAQAVMNAVGPRFFETMGIPIVAGRGIGPEDVASRPKAVVINEVAANRYFPGQSPIGRLIRVGSRDAEVIGVAASARYTSLRTEPPPTIYDSYTQRAGFFPPGLEKQFGSSAPAAMHVVLRANVPASALAAAIPAAVAEVEPQLALTDIKTQADQIDESIAQERLFARLLVVFGSFAVLLACIGLHGVTSYAVAQRTGEIGIRVALGAQRAQVLWLILRQVLVLALIGVALGVPMAIAAGPVVASMLFGLAARDVMTIAIASVLMLLVALGAGWLPARRAARMQVLAALRTE